MTEIATVLETSFRLLKGAARGNIEAQRDLAMQAVGLLGTRPDIDPVSVLMDGLLFARMAAAQGDNGDQGRVLSMLALLGEELVRTGDAESEEMVSGEAIARVALLAEQGVTIADEAVNRMVEGASPKALAMAKQYERALRA